MRSRFAWDCGDLFKEQEKFPDSRLVIDAMNNATNLKIMEDSVSVVLCGWS